MSKVTSSIRGRSRPWNDNALYRLKVNLLDVIEHVRCRSVNISSGFDVRSVTIPPFQSVLD